MQTTKLFLLSYLIISSLSIDIPFHTHNFTEQIHPTHLHYLDDSSFWNSSLYQTISDKLGFNKKQNLGKGDIKDFINSLVGQTAGDRYKESNFTQHFNDIIDKYVIDFPEQISVPELRNYLNYTKFIENVKGYFTEKPHLTMTDKFFGFVNTTWHNMTDVFTKLYDHTTGDQIFWNTTTYDKLYESLGYGNKKQIKRDEFTIFLHRLFISEKDHKKIPKAVREIFDRYTSDLPKHINTTDIHKLLNYTKFYDISKEVAKKHYGPTYMDKFKDFAEDKKGNITDLLFRVFNYTMPKHEEF